ncbi:MAG TPA: CPXCG motif-containing cysteine-rich protein [Longimicrobiales bacterium]|nr:CPXCG motif-containing cysteine-rich protein [Longimicrobiales bacterium]
MRNDDWLDGDDDDLDPDADLTESTWISCPYCGEHVEVLVDPTGGSVQEYVEDCEICCNPWNVRVLLDDDGNADVSVSTQDEE